MSTVQKNEKIDELRARVPAATCPDGCCACCAAGVRVSHSEMRRISPPGAVCLTGCVWLGADRRCRVYEERPIRCRLFGMAENPGSEFYCPECSGEMSDAEIVAIITEYEHLTIDEMHAYTALGQEVGGFDEHSN